MRVASVQQVWVKVLRHLLKWSHRLSGGLPSLQSAACLGIHPPPGTAGGPGRLGASSVQLFLLGTESHFQHVHLSHDIDVGCGSQ